MEPAKSGQILRRDEGRRLFGIDPQGYESGRPDYPGSVYETLVERCGLGVGSRVLEIGPGTGLVTRKLLAQGARVVAVEPDRSMARFLAEMAPPSELEIIPCTLEDAKLDSAMFDLAVAATSFHWVEQQVGIEKVGNAVRPGGWVALWWTLFRDPSQTDVFGEAVEELLGPATRGAFDEPGRPPFQLDGEHRMRDLTRWAKLERVTSQFISWTCVLTPSQARALYASMATVIRRPAEERRSLLDEVELLATNSFGGTVERHFLTALYTGQRPVFKSI